MYRQIKSIIGCKHVKPNRRTVISGNISDILRVIKIAFGEKVKLLSKSSSENLTPVIFLFFVFLFFSLFSFVFFLLLMCCFYMHCHLTMDCLFLYALSFDHGLYCLCNALILGLSSRSFFHVDISVKKWYDLKFCTNTTNCCIALSYTKLTIPTSGWCDWNDRFINIQYTKKERVGIYYKPGNTAHIATIV